MTHFIFDCDDVLLDWQGGFRAFLTERGYTPCPKGPTSWDMSEWIGCSDKQSRAYVEKFNASPAFGTLKACPGAKEIIWAIRDAGHTISVLTACGDGRDTARARFDNLFDQFRSEGPLTPFHKPYALYSGPITILPLGASKFEYLYDISRKTGDLVFVEDAFQHAQSGVINGIRSYCLRKTHNRAQERDNPDSDVIWIDDISQIPYSTGG